MTDRRDSAPQPAIPLSHLVGKTAHWIGHDPEEWEILAAIERDHSFVWEFVLRSRDGHGTVIRAWPPHSVLLTPDGCEMHGPDGDAGTDAEFYRAAYDDAHKACDDCGAPRSGDPEVLVGGEHQVAISERIRWLGREWARERDALRAMLVEARNTAEEALDAWLGWDIGSGRGHHIDEIRALYERLGLTPPPAAMRKP